jgi:hypothetical protein
VFAQEEILAVLDVRETMRVSCYLLLVYCWGCRNNLEDTPKKFLEGMLDLLRAERLVLGEYSGIR